MGVSGTGAGKPQDLCEDRQWLADFRAGLPAALERVFRAYAPYACAIINRGTASGESYAPGITHPEDRDDLLQDVFVRVLAPEMRQRYDGIRPYASFLGAVVRHMLIDRARASGRLNSRQRPLSEADDWGEETWLPGSPLPEQNLLAKEERALMSEFLTTLDKSERLFVRLRFQEGLAQRDVAKRLSLGRQRVRTLEVKIRSKLQTFLDSRNF